MSIFGGEYISLTPIPPLTVLSDVFELGNLKDVKTDSFPILFEITIGFYISFISFEEF